MVSLRVIGWGLVLLENSSAAVVAAVTAAAVAAAAVAAALAQQKETKIYRQTPDPPYSGRYVIKLWGDSSDAAPVCR